MKFEERPYNGKTFRPRPEIHFDPVARLLIVATPWGPRNSARRVIDRMVDYLALAREDREMTSPFQRLSCLSAQANNLRVATLLANEVLYRGENRAEYNSGVEVFASYLDEDELVWVQVGNPQVLLARPGRATLNLGSHIDMAYDFSDKELLAPMPAQMLGLDSSFNITVNSFRARPGDRMILLSHSQPPEFLFANSLSHSSLEEMVKSLAATHENVPFWIGIMTLESESKEEAA